MKEIISASRREDIISNYNRYQYLQRFLETGEYRICNKYQDTNTKVDLSNIGAICLWSKNYRNFIGDEGLLNNYNLYFNFTITGYSKVLEPGVIDTEEAIMQMKYLAKTYGADKINWRFDPICFIKGPIIKTEDYTLSGTLHRFTRLCDEISKTGVNRCTISFCDYYDSVKKRLSDNNYIAYIPNEDTKVRITEALVEIANNFGIRLYSCSSLLLEGVDGIEKSSCIDGKLLEKLYNIKFTSSKDSGQREHCGCTKSRDIGMYTKCPNGCMYCYGRI